MPIAKDILRIGYTVAALPGNYVTQSAVEQYGWQEQVDADDPLPDLDANNDAPESDENQRSTRKSKAAK